MLDSLTTIEPTIAEDFQHFIELDTKLKILSVKAGAAMILSGAELLRLHKKYGVSAGRPDNSRTRAEIKWPELVEQYGGISEDTASRRMKTAEACAEKLPLFRDVLGALTDGKSQRQLMWDFGLTTPKLRGGDRGNHSNRHVPTAEEQREGAEYVINKWATDISEIARDEFNLNLASRPTLETLAQACLTLRQKIDRIKEQRKK
jgi:hypothetical protein